MFLIFDLEILLIYPLAVTLYQVSTYGFWITMIFFAILTVGFVLEIGSGALYFTDQKSSVVNLRPEENVLPKPLLHSCLLGLFAISYIDCFSLNVPLDLSETLESMFQGPLVSLAGLDALSSLALDVAYPLYCVLGFRFIHKKSGLTGHQSDSLSQIYFKEIREKNEDPSTSNIYLMAKRHIASGISGFVSGKKYIRNSNSSFLWQINYLKLILVTRLTFSKSIVLKSHFERHADSCNRVEQQMNQISEIWGKFRVLNIK